jgi:ATP-binding cassette subfamily B protein
LDRLALPTGYDTVLGEMALTQPAGQCQRIGVARAFYRDPPVFLLDRSTSAFDLVTGRGVWSRLDAALVGSTALLITHDAGSARRSRRLLVLHKGFITRSGKPLNGRCQTWLVLG